jgi:hypothetical protein
MTRRRRTVASFLAAFALAFAQLVVAAHACILHEQAAPAEVMAHHDGCPGAVIVPDESPAGSNVCSEHCHGAVASLDNAPPAPLAADALGPVLRVQPSPAPESVAGRPAWRLAPAAAPPPAAILFGVLRI